MKKSSERSSKSRNFFKNTNFQDLFKFGHQNPGFLNSGAVQPNDQEPASAPVTNATDSPVESGPSEPSSMPNQQESEINPVYSVVNTAPHSAVLEDLSQNIENCTIGSSSHGEQNNPLSPDEKYGFLGSGLSSRSKRKINHNHGNQKSSLESSERKFMRQSKCTLTNAPNSYEVLTGTISRPRLASVPHSSKTISGPMTPSLIEHTTATYQKPVDTLYAVVRKSDALERPSPPATREKRKGIGKPFTAPVSDHRIYANVDVLNEENSLMRRRTSTSRMALDNKSQFQPQFESQSKDLCMDPFSPSNVHKNEATLFLYGQQDESPLISDGNISAKDRYASHYGSQNSTLRRKVSQSLERTHDYQTMMQMHSAEERSRADVQPASSYQEFPGRSNETPQFSNNNPFSPTYSVQNYAESMQDQSKCRRPISKTKNSQNTGTMYGGPRTPSSTSQQYFNYPSIAEESHSRGRCLEFPEISPPDDYAYRLSEEKPSRDRSSSFHYSRAAISGCHKKELKQLPSLPPRGAATSRANIEHDGFPISNVCSPYRVDVDDSRSATREQTLHSSITNSVNRSSTIGAYGNEKKKQYNRDQRVPDYIEMTGNLTEACFASGGSTQVSTYFQSTEVPMISGRSQITRKEPVIQSKYQLSEGNVLLPKPSAGGTNKFMYPHGNSLFPPASSNRLPYYEQTISPGQHFDHDPESSTDFLNLTRRKSMRVRAAFNDKYDSALGTNAEHPPTTCHSPTVDTSETIPVSQRLAECGEQNTPGDCWNVTLRKGDQVRKSCKSQRTDSKRSSRGDGQTEGFTTERNYDLIPRRNSDLAPRRNSDLIQRRNSVKSADTLYAKTNVGFRFCLPLPNSCNNMLSSLSMYLSGNPPGKTIYSDGNANRLLSSESAAACSSLESPFGSFDLNGIFSDILSGRERTVNVPCHNAVEQNVQAFCTARNQATSMAQTLGHSCLLEFVLQTSRDLENDNNGIKALAKNYEWALMQFPRSTADQLHIERGYSSVLFKLESNQFLVEQIAEILGTCDALDHELCAENLLECSMKELVRKFYETSGNSWCEAEIQRMLHFCVLYDAIALLSVFFKLNRYEYIP